MANALESASLVMIPSGYEDGTLGSLKPTDGSGDFTFSRGSNLSATRINEQGYIEKGYENLLHPSNDLASLTNNTFSGINVDSNQVANPIDGEVTADKLYTIVSGTSESRARISGYIQSGVQTISLYAKYIDYKYLYIRELANNKYSVFDIELGTITYNNTFTIETKIESAGNGWYRCSISFNASSISNNLIDIGFSASSTSPFGNVQDGVEMYLFGYMLNQGLVAYPYIETTTAPVAGGILEDMPRLDWSGSCPSLLLEPSRTNVLSHSEYLNGISWAGQVDITFTPNYGISPEGVKNSTRIQFADDTAYAYLSATITTNAVASVYVKGTSGETFRFGLANNAASGGLLHTFSGEWERISNTKNTNGQLIISSYGGTALDFEAYGLQLEQDASYPTSYIPTYGVSQTRLAEDVELPSLSSVFDSTGSFTLFFEIERLSSSVQQQILYIRGQGYFRLDATADNRLKFVIYGGGASVSEANSGVDTFVAGTSSKIIYKQNGTIGQCFVNGQEITNVNPTILTGFFTFYQRNENHIKHQEAYFPTALSDSECIALTTI